jgi:hypothetical protein
MKRISIIFAGVFLSLISLPFVFMDNKSVVSEKENRVLVSFPGIIEDGKINTVAIKNFSPSIDKYINDRFGFRNTAISLANNIFWAGKTINRHVVVGKNGWLFYSTPDDGNNIADFYKMNLFTEDELERFIGNIKKRRKWCEENNIAFIFLIAPNKHTIYPEYYPFERPDGITRTEQIIAALPHNLKNVVIYPRDYLLQNKSNALPLYFETDTHWNMAGAEYVFEILYNRVKNNFPNIQFSEIQFTTEISYDSSGDLVPMLGFTSYGKRTIPNVYPQEGWKSFYRYIKNEDINGVIIENNDQTLPRAIMYRDSFFMALEPFTSSIFSYAEYRWKLFTESEREYILEHKPDIIIWEVVERYSDKIPNLEWN